MISILSVGGFAIGLSGDAAGIPPELEPYRCDGAAPQARCRGRLGPLRDEPPGEPLFDSGGVWALQSLPGKRLRLLLRLEDGRPYHRLDLDPSLLEGESLLDPTGLLDSATPFALRAPLHELWTSFLLLRHGGMLVHGCGWLEGESVLVLAGESGAGKSTLARLLSDRGRGVVLSDDRLALRPEADGWRVWGTPWHGEQRFAAPHSGRLHKLCFLAHAPHTHSTPLSPAEGATRLLACCFRAGWPPADVDGLLARCAAAASSVPCSLLDFLPDPTALAALDGG